MIRREWLVLFAVTLACLFTSAMSFGSMGIVVFAMADPLNWSEAEAGSTFTSLTAVCALTSLLPIVLIPRIGSRGTFVAGSITLAIAFYIAWGAASLATMLVAAGLIGLAYSLVANTPGIYLIATWFGDRSPRIIALYLMVTNLGGVLGPLVADALVSGPGGWRSHWFWMTVSAVFLALLCAVLIRERPVEAAVTPARDSTVAPAASAAIPVTDQDGADWGLRGTVRQPQFVVLAIAMVATQACVITVSSIIAAHFTRLGSSSALAAGMLSLQALVGVVATGLAGPLGERIDPRRLLVASLVAQAAGMLLLAFAREPAVTYAFAVLFGAGWAVATFAITVLLIRWFGDKGGSAALSAVWMLCGLAAAAPSLAGFIADATGSFTPAIVAFGVLLLPIGAAAWRLRAPAEPVRSSIAPR